MKLLTAIVAALLLSAGALHSQSQQAARQRALVVAVVSANGSLTAGKHYAQFQVGTGATLTLNGAGSFAAGTTLTLPYLPVDTYSTLTYTVSGGSVTIISF